MKKLFLAFLLLVSFIRAEAQTINLKDSIVRCPVIMASYAFELPAGDLSSRFGYNSSVGFGGLYKTKKNLLWGLQWNYMFGNQLKEDTILNIISTSDSAVIDQEGTLAEIRLSERGFSLRGQIGKVVPLGFAPNRNSGLMLVFGLGYLQHKIRIDDIGNRAPQLRGDYKKGYDRLTGGVCIEEFVGYWHQGNKRLVNFFVGVECKQAFTHSLRSFDIPSNSADTQKRVDMLFGIRAGWMLPLYKRTAREFYIY